MNHKCVGKGLNFRFLWVTSIALLSLAITGCGDTKSNSSNEAPSGYSAKDLAASPSGGTYLITLNSNSSVSFDIPGMSTAINTTLENWALNKGTNQQWNFVAVTGTGYNDGYHIVNVNSGLCLDLATSSTANGVNLHQEVCQNGSGLTQVFQFNQSGNSYQIYNVFTGKCIDAGPNLGNGGLPEEWTCTSTYTSQFWNFTNLGSSPAPTPVPTPAGAATPVPTPPIPIPTPAGAATPTPIQPVPAAPTGLTATSASTSSVLLNWSQVSGATGYIIESMATHGSAPFAQIAQVGNVSTYTNTGLTSNWQYTYEVIALNSAGDSAPSASVTVQVQSTGSSPAPTPVPTPAAPPVATPAPVTPPPVTPPVGTTGGTIPAPSGAHQVSCNNNSGDASLIQNAMNSYSAVVLSGTCSIGSTTLSFGSNFYLGGSAILNYTGSSYAVSSTGNGNTVTGLTFNGGGLYLNKDDTTNWTGQYGWTIQANTFRNITSGNDGVHILNILGKGAASTISYNNFKNIWSGGYPNLPSSAVNCGQDNCTTGQGIYWENGIDQVTISNNTMDEIGFDGIKGFWDGFGGNTDHYTASGNVISNNIITNYHRIAIEFQDIGKGSCPGGCNYTPLIQNGLIISGNFAHLPAFTNNEFAFSFMGGSGTGEIINNTGNNDVATCYVRAGIGLEHAQNGGIVQGNVIGSIPQSCYSNGWADNIAAGYSQSGRVNDYQNNLICGPGSTAQGSVFNGTDPGNSATMVETADLWTNTCANPSNISASNIVMSFTSSSGSTFNVAVKDNISIRQVQFYLDGASTPVVTQAVQDMNTSFTSNSQWLYHATLSNLSSGSHTIVAVATDVSGTSSSVSQSFTH